MTFLKRSGRWILVVIPLAFGCTGATVTRSPADLVPAALVASKSVEERYRYDAEARLKAGLGFGYLAAVRENGKTAKVALGARSIEPKRPLAATDLFEIGSVSKAFTGILIHLAEAEGKLRIDQPLEAFFPELKGVETGIITLRELGTHRAGLPSFPDGVKSPDPKNPWAGLKRDEVLGALARYQRAPIPAGQTAYPRAYSNWGFLTLGLVLENVYGKSYPAIVEKRLLSPLGMHESGVDRKTRKRRRWISKLAPAFDLAGQPSPAWDFDGFAAAIGGIESNAADMAKFLEALESPPRGKHGKIGSAIEASFASGIGWDSDPGAPLARKNGMTGSYAAFVAIDRPAKKAIFVGANAAVSPDDLGTFALGGAPGDALLARATAPRVPSEEEVSRLKGRFRNPKPDADPAIPLRGIAVAESLGRLVGRYDFGDSSAAILLVPAEREDVWNLIDGLTNVDAIRVLKAGVRTTLTDSTHTAVIELEKIPDEVQQFPALEK